MTTATAKNAVAGVTFNPLDRRSYDYLIPEGLDLAVGDKVVVETKRGEAVVTVTTLKDSSDKATASILRRADPAPAETKPAEDWNF